MFIIKLFTGLEPPHIYKPKLATRGCQAFSLNSNIQYYFGLGIFFFSNTWYLRDEQPKVSNNHNISTLSLINFRYTNEPTDVPCILKIFEIHNNDKLN